MTDHRFSPDTERILESVARACAEKAASHEVTPMCPSIYNQVVERNIRYFMAVLRQRLGLLLESAEAMHDNAQGDYEVFGAAFKVYDAAKRAALEGE